jgi:hypothetical protein
MPERRRRSSSSESEGSSMDIGGTAGVRAGIIRLAASSFRIIR